MATVPSPRTWTASEAVTAAKLNADVRDAWNYFLAKPVAILGRTSAASQAISSGGSAAVLWTNEVMDTDGGHSTVTNTSRYTAQTAGWYFIQANIRWTALNPLPVWIDLLIRKNGSTDQCRSTQVTHIDLFNPTTACSGFINLSVSDYVEVVVQPLLNSGEISNEDDCQMYIEWVST